MSWKAPDADDFVLCYRGRTLYCKVENRNLVLPRVKDVAADALQYAFSIDERADYLLSPDGDIYLNEINTFPGMTEKSLYPGMCRESGISFTAMLTILINSALRRGNA